MKAGTGFIGCGNMGGALIRAAVKSEGPEHIMITDQLADKAQLLAKETGACACDIKDIAASCRYIFLGVKPQGMKAMLEEIKDILAVRMDPFVLITMAAGTPIERIKGYAGDYPVIRIMPNLPVSVGEGMILYCVSGVSDEDVKAFRDILKYAGKLCPLEEKLIDAGSAISGCGPAYVYMFIEALADGGVQCGLPRDKAMLLASQTVMGSAAHLMETGRHPGELKDKVCSPGGTTIAGVHALEEKKFRAAVSDAVLAAYEKTLKL